MCMSGRCRVGQRPVQCEPANRGPAGIGLDPEIWSGLRVTLGPDRFRGGRSLCASNRARFGFGVLRGEKGIEARDGLVTGHLAQPLAQSSIRQGHCVLSSGRQPQSRRSRPPSPELAESAESVNEKPPVSSCDIGGNRLNQKAGEGDRTPDIQLGNARAADQIPRESGHFRRTPRSLAHGLAQGRA
jgi:hypothetical protein